MRAIAHLFAGHRAIDPYADKASAEAWLKRQDPIDALKADLLEEEELEGEALGELVSFAATAVEMWGICGGLDPVSLVQQIALGGASQPPA